MDYQKQGRDFLKKYNINVYVKFLKNDYHFQDDKCTRDIFRITFKREGKQFSIRFGQSIKESTGAGENKPTAYNVLTCLQKYEVGSFEDFINEYGYNSESLEQYPKVRKIYNACIKEYNKVESFFTENEILELQDIQ